MVRCDRALPRLTVVPWGRKIRGGNRSAYAAGGVPRPWLLPGAGQVRLLRTSGLLHQAHHDDHPRDDGPGLGLGPSCRGAETIRRPRLLRGQGRSRWTGTTSSARCSGSRSSSGPPPPRSRRGNASSGVTLPRSQAGRCIRFLLIRARLPLPAAGQGVEASARRCRVATGHRPAAVFWASWSWRDCSLAVCYRLD